MEGWGSDKVCVPQRGFYVAVSGCPPPVSPGTRGSVRAPRPTRPASPISQPPCEILKSGPDVAAGPATLKVKVKGNHVKFATHHHFLDREINRSGLGAQVRHGNGQGGIVSDCRFDKSKGEIKRRQEEGRGGNVGN